MINALRALLIGFSFTLLVAACGGGGGGGNNTTNHAPTLSAISDVSVIAGNNKIITLAATDLDNDSVSFTVSGGSTATVNATVSGSTLTITPASGYVTAAPITFTVTANDGRSGSDSKSFNVTVTAAPVSNHAPVLSAISNINMIADNNQTITLNALDQDNDSISFTVSGGSAATVSAAVSGSTLTITPASGYVTSAPITFTVTANDGRSGSDSKGFDVTVTAQTAPPTKVIIKLATAGTLPQGSSIGAIDTTISFSTNKGLTITADDILTSGVASGATMFPNLATNGEIRLGTISGSGFGVGEFATLTFSIASGNSPTASDFSIKSAEISDYNTILTIPGINVVLQSITFM